MEIFKKHIKQLMALCKKHTVKELYVFGSATSNSFNRDSDIDFLVEFNAVDLLEYFDNYMDFKEALEKLFSRKIDLVEVQTIKNPILKKSIDQDKVLIYGSTDTKIAV